MAGKVLKSYFKNNKLMGMGMAYLCIMVTAAFLLLLDISAKLNKPVEVAELPVIEKAIVETIEEVELVYNANDVRVKSNLNEESLKEILTGEMKELAPYLIEAEEEYGINAMVLASMIDTASNGNTSERAEEWNNLFNLGVYDSSCRGLVFESEEECIDFTANLLAEQYLSEEGAYFNGYSLEAISISYCNGSSTWVNNINNNIYNNYIK